MLLEIINRIRHRELRSCSFRFVSSKTTCQHTESKLWKVLFFGTDDFSLESLKILHSNSSRLLSRLEVVTASNKCDVIKYSDQHQISVRNWPLKSAITDFDIGVVVSFGHLIPKNIINAFPLGMINVHGSLLPRWRGSCPINYALINGDQETGITIMKIAPKKFDIGDIILQRGLEIGADETLQELRQRLARCGAKLLLETIEKLPEILTHSIPQDNTNVTYAHKLQPEQARINWNTMTAKDIYNLQRGLMGEFTMNAMFEKHKVKFHNILIYNNSPFIKPYQDVETGTALFDKKTKTLLIKCKGNSWISVGSVTVGNHHVTRSSDFSATYLSGMHRKTLLFTIIIEEVYGFGNLNVSRTIGQPAKVMVKENDWLNLMEE